MEETSVSRKEGEYCVQGEFQHGLDAKGRLILPAKIREELGTQFVLTKGMDGCLFIFPPESWENFAGKLNALSNFFQTGKKAETLLYRKLYRMRDR